MFIFLKVDVPWDLYLPPFKNLANGAFRIGDILVILFGKSDWDFEA